MTENPIVGIANWARETAGSAAAIPSPAMKSRRFIVPLDGHATCPITPSEASYARGG